jgi:hypothetical protein
MQKDQNQQGNRGSIVGNENGAVLIAALMILVLLTIIGIASTMVSNTEIQISTNELVYQQNFYRAEGATIEAAELLDGLADPKSSPPAWLEPDIDQISNTDIHNDAFWISGLSDTIPQASSTLDNTNFVVLSEGIVSGTSLGMGSSKVHAYSVFGRSAPPNRGATIIEIGYLKAF